MKTGDGEIRIGLVGLDSSHVQAFLGLFNGCGAEHISGGKIVAAFKGGSPEIEASRLRIDRFAQLATEQYGVRLHESIEAMAAQIDAFMILSVDGRQHLPQFRQVAGLGKPVFIDKPLAGSLRDAVAIARLAEKTLTPCFSASSFRFLGLREAECTSERVTAAFSFGPADREPHHPDLFWYGIHAVEALFTALGPGCRQVARTCGSHTDIVVGLWTNGRIGVVQGNRHAFRGHGVTVFATDGVISGGAQHSYRPLASAILKFFQNRAAPVPLEETVEIHAFMEAAEESKRRWGMPVILAEVMAG